MKKALILGAASILSVGIALAQPAPAAKPATPAGSDPVVMKIGTTEVHQSEFNEALKSLPAEYQQYAQSAEGKKAFADDYLRMKVLAAEAEKQGLDKDASVIAQLRLMRENALANAELTKLEGSIDVSDAELKQLYEAKKATLPEQAHARHILIAPSDSPAASPDKPKLTDEQAKKKAEEIRAKLVAGGDFAEIAKKESDDPGSGAKGGDLGTFAKGQMVPEFDQAVFEGKVGEISPVVKTQYGYHIIQVQERGVTPFEKMKDQLAQQARRDKLQAKIDALKAQSNATVNSAYFAPPAPPAVPAPAPAPAPVKK